MCLYLNIVLVLMHFPVVSTKTFIEKDDYLTKIKNPNLRSLTDKLLTECPNTNLCGTYIHTEVFKNGDCCIECSCENDCRYKYSCCPHVLPTFLDTEAWNDDIPCRPAVILANRKDIPKQYIGNEYYLISKCPRSTDSFLKALCEREPSEMFNLEYAAPLYDYASGLSYFNKYCTICNGVRNRRLIRWIIQIGCKETWDLGTWHLQRILKMVSTRNDCFIQFLPPTSVDVSPTLCDTDKVISHCNVTGLMPYYDSYLDEACMSYPLSYRVQTETRRRYKNVFCAICNGEMTNHTKCNPLPMETLITSKVSFIEPDEIRKDNCKIGYLYDPITTKCQKIRCTSPYRVAPYVKKCVRIYQPYAGQTPFSIWICLKALPGTFRDFSDLNMYISQIYKYLVRMTKLGICSIEFLAKINKRYTDIHLLSSTNSPKVTHILMRIHIDIGYNMDPDYPEKKYKEIIKLLQTEMPLNIFSFYNLLSIDSEVDPMFQTKLHPQVRSMTIEVRKAIWRRGGYPDYLTAFEDPYDNMTVLQGFQYNPDDVKCDLTSRVVPTDTSLACATIMYNSYVTKFWRAPSGIVFDRNISFGFGEFRSLNETHILICADSVKTKVLTSKGMFEDPDILVNTFLLMGLFFVADFTHRI